ncbi:hypothetical protein MN608_08525 [Microdochium nivale]|nr:hypothetical protein MN608_08525 [Microdochium nivale]
MDVAGVALGAISLGLEVCNGLYQFIDGVQGQAHDLEVLGRHARTLEANLTATRDAITRLQQSRTAGALHAGTAGSIVAVSSSVISCQADLRTLQELLVRYAGGCGIANPSFRERCRQTFRTLEYGFHGGKRDKMESLLATVNGNLIVGMEALGLNMTIDSDERAAATESRIVAKLDAQGRDESQFRADAVQHLDLLANRTASIRTEVQSAEKNLSKQLDRGQLVAELAHTSVTTIETSVLPAMQAEARQFSASALKQLGEITNQLALGTAPRDEINSSTLMAVSRDVRLNQETLNNMSVALNHLLIAQQYPSQPSVSTQVSAHLDLTDVATQQKQVISSSSTLTDLSPMCSCKSHSSSRKLWTAQFGVSQITATRTETTKHRLGCAYYASAMDRKARRKDINTRVRLFSVVVNLALNLSGGWTSGHGVRKLRQLYSTDKVSGTDVTIDGDTLAYSLFDLMLECSHRIKNSEAMLSLIRPLWLECMAVIGVSFTQEDFDGKPPYLSSIIFSRSDFMVSLIHFLLPSELRGSLLLPPPDYYAELILPVPIGSEWMLAEVCDLDLLGDAILRNQGLVVERLVAGDPALCMQSAIFEWNHFELSISAGLCLPNLIAGLKASEHGRHLLRNLLGSPSKDKDSLPTWALSQCRTDPPHSPGALTHRCPYATVMSVLTAEDDCVVSPPSGPFLIGTPCADCLETYCRALYHRRIRLKDFAAARLSHDSITEFGLDKDIPLDRHAAAVVARLTVSRIKVPVGLSVGFDVEQTPLLSHGAWWSSDLDNALFTIGFRDVEAPNADGHSPLQVMVIGALSGRYNTDKCSWLIEHGADQSQPFIAQARARRVRSEPPRNNFIQKILNANGAPAITVMHALAAAIGGEHIRLDGVNLLKRMLPEPCLRDNSDCLCGPGLGWDPFLYFAAAYLNLQPSDETDITYIIAWKVKQLFELCEKWLPVTRYKDVFRYITFETLSLEHTTCILAGEDSDSDSDSDVISGDESEESSFLESIVTELDTAIDAWSAARAQDNLQSTQAESSESPNDQAQSITSERVVVPPWGLWLDTWELWAKEALAQLDLWNTNEEDLSRAEDLGVVWDKQVGDDIYAMSTPENYRPRPNDEDFWHRIIEDIN